MKTFATAMLFTLWPVCAQAAWVEVEGGATAKPEETNSTIELIMLHCVDSPVLDVYSRNDGPILSEKDPNAVADYFYKKGAVRAEIDGKAFPLAAAGSDIAVVLFSEGEESQSFLAPLDPAFLDAMKSGRVLTLLFDILPEPEPNGSPFDTWARFSLENAGALIDKATGGCR